MSAETVANNAYMQYVRSRPTASSDSNKRVKELNFDKCGFLPIFQTGDEEAELLKEDFLDQMKNYRPQGVSLSFFFKFDSLIQLTNNFADSF